MLPNLHFLGFELNWYYFFPCLGLFTTILFGLWYIHKNINIRLSVIQTLLFFFVLYILLMTGGRIVGAIENYLKIGSFPDISVFFAAPSAGRFRWCGSLLMVLLFLPVISKKLLRIQNFNTFFDMLVLSFCVLTVFTKQACQFSGDGCYGIATTLPWGMYYPYGVAPNILPVHPTPIYDSLFHLIFFIVLLYWDTNRKKIAGQTSKIYFIFVPIFYILLEVIRLNPVVAYGITLPQVVYTLILLSVIPIFKMLIKDGSPPFQIV